MLFFSGAIGCQSVATRTASPESDAGVTAHVDYEVSVLEREQGYEAAREKVALRRHAEAAVE